MNADEELRMAKNKVFQVKGITGPRLDGERSPWHGVPRPKFGGAEEGEILTRMVLGQEASEIEERFYRAAEKNPDVYSGPNARQVCRKIPYGDETKDE